MPTKWAQELYWNISDTTVPPAPVNGLGGYPMWQAAVVAPSLFGMIGAWIDTHWTQLQWLYRFMRRLHQLEPERRAVIVHALEAVEHPAYAAARVVVRETATTVGFNRPEAWKDLSREMKSDNGRVENVYRHLRAMHRLRDLHHSTLSNPQQNLLTELAYHGFSLMGK